MIKKTYHCQPEKPHRPEIVSKAKARTPLMTDEKFPRTSSKISLLAAGQRLGTESYLQK